MVHFAFLESMCLFNCCHGVASMCFGLLYGLFSWSLAVLSVDLASSMECVRCLLTIVVCPRVHRDVLILYMAFAHTLG